MRENSNSAVRPPHETAALSRRALVVLGMHRSGTSAMARTLSLLGASLPAALIGAQSDNETGFWEAREIVLLNDEILEGLDSDWEDVFSFRPKRYLSNFDRVYLGRAMDLLEQEFKGSELIVLKDPRISVLVEFWDRALREAGYAPHYVIMVRNPLEVSESLRVRNGFPRQKSLLLWACYMIASARGTRKCDRTFIAYDHLMNDWRSVRDRIEKDAGVPFPRDTATAAIEIDRHLDRRLRHHGVPANDLLDSRDVPYEIKALYRIFSEACEGNEVDEGALSSVETQLEKLDLLVGPVVADLRASACASAKNAADLQSHNAAVCERADRVEGLFAAEKALRRADAEERAASVAEYELRLAELATRVSETEADRDRISAEALEQHRKNVEDRETVEQRIAALTQELRQQETKVTHFRDALKTTAKELSKSRKELQKTASEVTRVQEQYEREIERAAVAFARDLQAAEEARDRNDAAAREEVNRILQEADREIERVRKDLQNVEQARNRADTAARASESKLTQQYKDLAKLTNLLRERELQSERKDAQIARVVAIHECLSVQTRWWWTVLPTNQRRERALRLLQKAGLFDADAYLRVNPDVRAAGMDPLDHYLRHGFWEDRPSG